MQARFAPQSDAEARALAAAGHDVDRVFDVEDLVEGPAFFVATGVTGGSLLARPRALNGAVVTESLVISERSVTRVKGRYAPEHREVG
jgi:fructose-1,6-bisphosphatase II